MHLDEYNLLLSKFHQQINVTHHGLTLGAGGCLTDSRRIVVGGWAWACWGVTNVSRCVH